MVLAEQHGKPFAIGVAFHCISHAGSGEGGAPGWAVLLTICCRPCEAAPKPGVAAPTKEDTLPCIGGRGNRPGGRGRGGIAMGP